MADEICSVTHERCPPECIDRCRYASQTSREERLEAALREIIEDAPAEEPQGTAGCGDGGASDDWSLGWDQCHWKMAQIAREALTDGE